ncbi:hypothetical protein E3N88_20052 [Mikania micrantha]|uniref:Uncharacterized protein n=1 Tax=Mikania micrantha TaxID=192012 RepID=A0A5N6NH45_9ASTR|nr:hypothetical protein E3N88_20052 [Mikania micrantha]
MLGLDYKSKRGYIGLEYYGRTVSIKNLPVGIDIGKIESVKSSPETASKVQELRRRYNGKTVMKITGKTDLPTATSSNVLTFTPDLDFLQKPISRKQPIRRTRNPAAGVRLKRDGAPAGGKGVLGLSVSGCVLQRDVGLVPLGFRFGGEEEGCDLTILPLM